MQLPDKLRKLKKETDPSLNKSENQKKNIAIRQIVGNIDCEELVVYARELVEYVKPIMLNNKYSVQATIQDIMRKEYNEIRILIEMLRFYSIQTLSKGSVKTLPKTFSGLEPGVFLMHMKKAHNINYMQWDHNDPYFKLILPKALDGALKLIGTPGSVETFQESIDLERARSLLINSEKHALDATNMRCNTAWSEVFESLNQKFVVHEKRGIALMLLQHGAASEEYRIPGLSVLDPWDWDRVPALASRMKTKEETKETNINAFI